MTKPLGYQSKKAWIFSSLDLIIINNNDVSYCVDFLISIVYSMVFFFLFVSIRSAMDYCFMGLSVPSIINVLDASIDFFLIVYLYFPLLSSSMFLMFLVSLDFPLVLFIFVIFRRFFAAILLLSSIQFYGST